MPNLIFNKKSLIRREFVIIFATSDLYEQTLFIFHAEPRFGEQKFGEIQKFSFKYNYNTEMVFLCEAQKG